MQAFRQSVCTYLQLLQTRLWSFLVCDELSQESEEGLGEQGFLSSADKRGHQQTTLPDSWAVHEPKDDQTDLVEWSPFQGTRFGPFLTCTGDHACCLDFQGPFKCSTNVLNPTR